MASLYSTGFYEDQQQGSVASAAVIAPLVLKLFPSRSVVDVGCGVGGWLRAFSQLGVGDYLGLDGDYVPRDMLKISSEHFRPTNLAELTSIGRRFDLACSLEVAEHLPQSSARRFVAALVEAAPTVLFSAAVPGQGGLEHVNEQWQSYWWRLFAELGYVAVDCIRPAVFDDPRVEWWYRQNAVIYCAPERVPAGYSPVASRYELDRIDAQLLQENPERCQPRSGQEAIASIVNGASVLGHALGRRLGLTRNGAGG